MPFALDASAALAWVLPEESPAAEQARARIAADNALVPALWWFELRNGLIINERRGRITEDETADFLRRVAQFAIAGGHDSFCTYRLCRNTLRAVGGSLACQPLWTRTPSDIVTGPRGTFR